MTESIRGNQVCINIASLWRPERFEPLLANLLTTTKIPATLQFVVEDNDLDSITELDRLLPIYPHTLRKVLSSARNCNEAINVGFIQSTEPFFAFSGDDIEFTPGWLETLLSTFSDPTIHVTASNDGLCDLGMSLYLMRRQYIEKFGTIDSPGRVVHGQYVHCWVDTEFLETAESRGVFKYVPESIVYHLHWASARSTGAKDRTANYLAERENNTSHGGDNSLYQTRRRMWTK